MAYLVELGRIGLNQFESCLIGLSLVELGCIWLNCVEMVELVELGLLRVNCVELWLNLG